MTAVAQVAEAPKKPRVQRKPKEENITTTFVEGRQSWEYTVIEKLTMNGVVHKIKTVVHTEAWEQQTYCRTYHWDGVEWKYVVSIPTVNMTTVSQRCYSRPFTKTPPVQFLWDYNAAKRLALAILF